MSKQPKATWPQIEMAAKQEKWDFVDDNLGNFLDRERFDWALRNIKGGDNNRNTRDLAARVFNRMPATPFSDVQHVRLREQMDDRMEYHIVRYRIAIAFWQRGIRFDSVRHMVQDAACDPDLRNFVLEVFGN